MWFHYPKAYPKSINTKASQIVYITIPFTHLQRIMRWKFNSISYFRRGEAFRRHIQSIICLCISEQYGSSYFGHLLEMCRALLWLCNVELCTFSLSFHLLFSSLFNALTCSICVGNQLLLPRSLSLCMHQAKQILHPNRILFPKTSHIIKQESYNVAHFTSGIWLDWHVQIARNASA